MNAKIGVGLCVILTLLCWGAQKPLARHVEKLREDAAINLELSRHKGDYLSRFQAVLTERRLPAAKLLDSNEWIQVVQGIVSEGNLRLQELKPIRNSLFLITEGSMQEILKFFYRIASAQDFIYIKSFSLTLPDPNSESIRAQFTLEQFH